MSKNIYACIDRKIVRSVRYYAWKLKLNTYFSWCEVEDLEQELMMEVLAAMKFFDPTLGKLSTFIHCVLEKRSKNLIKKYLKTKNNKPCILVPIDDYAECEELQTDDLEQAYFVKQLISKLPPKHRKLCEILRRHNVADAAEILGISINTIYIRIRFLRRFINDLTNELPQIQKRSNKNK
jgi:RNA polymerase sigma-70 factor (ECF subfamily)